MKIKIGEIPLLVVITVFITLFSSFHTVHAGDFLRRHLGTLIETAQRMNLPSYSTDWLQWQDELDSALDNAIWVYSNPNATYHSLGMAIEHLGWVIESVNSMLPPTNNYNDSLYYKLSVIHDLIYEAAINIQTMQIWQIGLLSFTAGILTVLVIAVIWGRLS